MILQPPAGWLGGADELDDTDRLGEALDWLGEALDGLGAIRDPRWRHSILEETALACVDERLPRAALAFQTVVVEAARRWSNALAMSDALVRRTTMLQSLGAPELAASDLAEARLDGRRSAMRGE